MKVLFNFLGTVLLCSMSIPAAKAEITQCKVAKTTKMRLSGLVVKQGLIAVTRTGEKAGPKEILSDAMIYFQSSDGKISEAYQWMYNPVNKVQNRDNKYLSTSYGEDVVVTMGTFDDPEGQMTVTYVGTKSGNYLTLLCE